MLLAPDHQQCQKENDTESRAGVLQKSVKLWVMSASAVEGSVCSLVVVGGDISLCSSN